MRVTAEGREMIDGLRQNLASCVELAAEMGMAQGGLELIPVPRAEVLAAVALCDRLLGESSAPAPAPAGEGVDYASALPPADFLTVLAMHVREYLSTGRARLIDEDARTLDAIAASLAPPPATAGQES